MLRTNGQKAARDATGRVVVAVVGPTATGKSDLAIALALRLALCDGGQGEVVNADAFQLYRGMDVGTAKVPVAQRRGVVHHQLDVIDPSEDASVAAFQREARADVAGILERGGRPVVAGGSGLYVRALLDHIDIPPTAPGVRAALEHRAEVEGTRPLHDELARRDPQAAASIGVGNTKRIGRALEVIEITGEPFSAHLPVQEYVRPTVQIGLDHDRAALDARVAARVERMWRDGLVDEVRTLSERGMGRTASRAVGYAEVLAMLGGEIDEAEAQEHTVAATRRLTRKQMGWFGRDPRIVWLDAQAPDVVEQALAVVERADAGTLDPVDLTVPVRRTLGS